MRKEVGWTSDDRPRPAVVAVAVGLSLARRPSVALAVQSREVRAPPEKKDFRRKQHISKRETQEGAVLDGRGGRFVHLSIARHA